MIRDSLLETLRLQNVLDAMDGIAYVLDAGGHIRLTSDRAWRDFAISNGAPELTPESVVGAALIDLIAGSEVQDAYRQMHRAIQQGRRSMIAFDYRCDSPQVERHMRMSVGALRVGGELVGLLYQSQLVDERVRPAMNIFDFKQLAAYASADRPVVTMCSYCQRLAWPPGAAHDQREWVTAETYYHRGGRENVQISHGICSPCYETVVRPNI